MKGSHIIRIFFLVLISILATNTDVYSQSKKKQKEIEKARAARAARNAAKTDTTKAVEPVVTGEEETTSSRRSSRSSDNDDVIIVDGDNQTRRAGRQQSEFASRLWYGGGFALNFSGVSVGGAQGSTFLIGISPLIGYKITENISIGPRFEINYLTGRIPGNFGENIPFSSTSYGAGIFSRLKVAQVAFAHVEYNYISDNSLAVNFNDNSIRKTRFGNDQLLLGVGYNNGYGAFGTDVYILYNVLEDGNSANLPITYRFGFSYRF